MIIKEKINNFAIELEIEGDFKDYEYIKIKKAVRHICEVVSSDEFKNWCLGFNYKYTSCSGFWLWKKCYENSVDNFNWNNRLTNKEIYEKIMSGSEALSPAKDKTANITLKIDRSRSRGVLGYTYPNSNKQWIYSWFLKSDYKKIAGNIFHEYMHKLGFDHARRYHYTRQFTTPYAVGYFVRDFKTNS